LFNFFIEDECRYNDKNQFLPQQMVCYTMKSWIVFLSRNSALEGTITLQLLRSM